MTDKTKKIPRGDDPLPAQDHEHTGRDDHDESASPNLAPEGFTPGSAEVDAMVGHYLKHHADPREGK